MGATRGKRQGGLVVAIVAVVVGRGVVPCGASTLDRANELYSGGQNAQAIPLYKRALARGENPALGHFNLGNAYFQLDSLSQAVVHYRASTYHAPDFFRGYLNLAVVYYNLDELGECIAALHRALELEPGNAKAQMVSAAAYRRAGAYREAAALFQRIVERHPDRIDAYIPLGEIYRDLDDPVEAVRWLLRYPQTGPQLPHVRMLLADIHEQRGETTKALYYLRKVFEDDRQRRWILYRIVGLHAGLGNGHVALEEAQRGMELFPDFDELALVAGNLAFELELYSRAERYYAAARDLGNSGGIVGLENVRVVRREQAEKAVGERTGRTEDGKN